MDRRKSDAKVQLKKLEDECRSTVHFLNKLLETCSTHVNVLDTISSNEFRKHSQYFLAITQFQSETYQKLLQINFDLEEHLVLKEVPSLEQFHMDSTKVNATQDHLTKVDQVLIKPDTLKLYVDELVETGQCSDKIDKNHSETQSHCLHIKKEEQKLEICAEVKIIDKLKILSEKAVREKAVLKSVPGVTLQASQKKMSAVIQEKSVKCSNTRSLIDVDAPSSEEDFPVENTSVIYIQERVAPKINDLCMLGYIVSPSHFYIQVADENSGTLDVLSTQLESLASYTCASLLKVEAQKTLGKFCCMKSNDQWYRVEVLDWMLDITGFRQDQVLLQLVDYGNTFHASYKELCPMLQELFNIPKMAQLCHLDGLYPPGSTLKNILTQWPEKSINGFFNICGDLNSSIFQITHVSKDGNSFAIDMINTNENNGDNSIGQILFDANLAVEIFDPPIVGNTSIMNQILMSHGLHNIKPGMTRDEILETYFSQTNMKEARTINEAVMDYDPRDEANTCRNLRKDGTCYKGDQCTLQHVPLKDGFTRDKHPVYNRAFVDTPMPSTGDEVSLTISHICDIERFYVQIRNVHSRDCDRPSINTLISDMNNPETVKLYKNLRYPPALSQLVIVKHWNSHWYRGQVKSVTIPENNEEITVEVCVVDFGDILVVPMSDLRMIMREFLTIPFQAIECRFYNVKHKNGANADEEKKYFESRYLGQTFNSKIIAAPGYLVVLLYTKDNEDLGEKLIANGYGEEKTDHNFPKENEIYLID